jgi:DNA-binding LacI/PurR family transcriptional regulator
MMNQELLRQIHEIRNGGGGNSLPFYLRIRKTLEELILSGALPDGYRLPPDRELSEMLGTTHITLGKALNELRNQGLLGRSRALGTFVKAPATEPETIPGEKNKLVALVFDQTTQSTFQSGLFISLHHYLQKAGLEILFLSSNASPSTQFEQLQGILNKPNCCGCIVWSILGAGQVRTLMQMKPADFPLIFLDKYYEEAAHDAVVYNSFAAGQEIGRHFLRRGWKKFIFLVRRETLEYSSIRDRLNGLKRIVAENNLNPDAVEVVSYGDINEINPQDFAEKCRSAALISGYITEAKSILSYLQAAGCNLESIKAHGTFNTDHKTAFPHDVLEYDFQVDDLAEKAVTLLLSRLNGDRSGWKLLAAKGKLIQKTHNPLMIQQEYIH